MSARIAAKTALPTHAIGTLHAAPLSGVQLIRTTLRTASVKPAKNTSADASAPRTSSASTKTRGASRTSNRTDKRGRRFTRRVRAKSEARSGARDAHGGSGQKSSTGEARACGTRCMPASVLTLTLAVFLRHVRSAPREYAPASDPCPAPNSSVLSLAQRIIPHSPPWTHSSTSPRDQ
ncbi:hypothetical protein EXIGLDRAFT_411871 [Exidia glandulosa HHB12029]|uniref:Uncharacterized protein n=1 Tax=Exidia glandulosa HHB12029 TaxID=1314781 RepID=A0A165KPX8_EXIGL|nr:hypothetical protein EXIGLDRAFT_411871 [Exidia glandulosa HHB12029]